MSQKKEELPAGHKLFWKWWQEKGRTGFRSYSDTELVIIARMCELAWNAALQQLDKNFFLDYSSHIVTDSDSLDYVNSYIKEHMTEVPK